MGSLPGAPDTTTPRPRISLPLYNVLLGLIIPIPHIRASTPQIVQPSCLTGNKGHFLNHCLALTAPPGLPGLSQLGRRRIWAVRRKEGYLSHSFRPEEAIRLMALTRGQQDLWLQSWALPPPSFLSCRFLLCPAARMRVQPGPGPRSRRAGRTAVVSTPCLRKFSMPAGPRQIQGCTAGHWDKQGWQGKLEAGTRDGTKAWGLGSLGGIHQAGHYNIYIVTGSLCQPLK